MSKNYKAKITLENLAAFKEAYDTKEKIKAFEEYYRGLHYGNWDHPLVNKMRDCFKRMFNATWGLSDYKLDKNTFNNLEILISYTISNNLLWNVDYINDLIMVISFSGNHFVWHKDYCELSEVKNYDNLTLAELKAIGTGNTSIMNLPIEMNSISIDSIKEDSKDLKSQYDKLKKEHDDCYHYQTGELAEMKKAIEKMETELREKREEIQAQLNAKMAELNKQMAALEKQMYMMESQIYVIRSYSGETVEIKQVREGFSCNPNTPLVINQKIMYLDEDLARLVSIYQGEIAAKYNMFEDALKYVDDVFESFCPQERSVTFFRLSNKASYNYYNCELKMYRAEELIHGKKMGFVLRDGENAFIGWLDEKWGYDKDGEERKVTFQENLMYKPGETSVTHVDDAKYGTGDHNTNTMLSRLFAMSVVQGILDNGNIIEFPEKVNIMSPGRYIVFNYATAWIADDRFGDFASLVENLNKRTKVNDIVLVTYNKEFCTGRGEHDRAHDCKVPEGLNRVNFLESNDFGNCTIYVSAKKRYSYTGATANVLLNPREYINITYMNSIWLRYYIQTKKMGAYCEDYAKMIKHLKKAVEHLEEREAAEIASIKVYFPEADQIPEWQIKLSHWKMKNKIRFITDFQAKRIAKYFEAGEFYEIENLFKTEESYGSFLDLSNYAKSFERNPHVWGNETYFEFHPKSEYGKQHFKIDLPSLWDDEKNQKVIDEKLPEMVKRVESRIPQDCKKLELIRKELIKGFSEKGILEEMKAGEELRFINREKDFEFLRIEELNAAKKADFLNNILTSYPKYVRTSELWRLAYYDHIHDLYRKLVSESKLVLHEHFMQDTIII